MLAIWIVEIATLAVVVAFWVVATKPYVYAGHESLSSEEGSEAYTRTTRFDLFLANVGKMTARYVKAEVCLVAYKRAEDKDGSTIWLRRGGGGSKYLRQINFNFLTMVPGQRINLDIEEFNDLIVLDRYGPDDILKIEAIVTYRWILLGKCWRFREEFEYDLLAYGSTDSSSVPELSGSPNALPSV